MIGIVALLILGGGVWLAAGLLSAAKEVKNHATAAQTALVATQSAITTGDVVGARTAVAAAHTEVSAAESAAGAFPIRVLAHIPVINGAVQDLDHLIAAADQVVSATAEIVQVYGQVSGKNSSSRPIFAHGQIDLGELGALSTSVAHVDATLAAAQSDLTAVHATLPGTASLASARDSAQAEIAPLRATLGRVKSVLPLLPPALGSGQTRRYLVAILNQGEMRASGGAPLSLAMVTFTKGKFSVPIHGQLGLLKKPGLGILTWTGAPGSPWNDAAGERRATFANANFNPDFRSAGMDLAAAWAASGAPKVDGVIGIDTTAIAEVLRRTGPISTPAFGQLTADNLGQKLLIDAYRQFSSDQLARLKANQIVVDVMLQRLTSGHDMLAIVRALGAAAPERHFQLYVADKALSAQVHALGIDGALSAGSGDRVGVFLQNVNSSKVDVFNRRTVTVNAEVGRDGSASITQTIHVTNATPSDLPATRETTGYTTTWAVNAYFVYRPASAQNVTFGLPAGFRMHPWPSGTFADDGHGNWTSWVVGTLAPRASASFTMSYRLPPGTFRSASGDLGYRLVADPAPTWQTENLVVVVKSPNGSTSTQRLALDHPLDITMPVA